MRCLSQRVVCFREDNCQLYLRRRPDRRSRNHRRDLHPVMQGTAGFFSTVNTKETDWRLTDQDRKTRREERNPASLDTSEAKLLLFMVCLIFGFVIGRPYNSVGRVILAVYCPI